MNKKKTTGIVLSVIGVLSLVLITAGVTYAFFSYAKEGTTENTITTGTITFLYDEKEATGNGIKITEALPMSDTDGKALTGDNNVFDFQVTAKTTSKTAIPYEVTARMKADSDKDLQDKVKLYLTTVNGGAETAAPLTVNGDVVKTFASLTQTSKVGTDVAVEKTIYNGEVPASSTNYSQDFKLRMWIAGDETTENGANTDYSPYEFVKKTAVVSAAALKADELIASKDLITSAEYYALESGQDQYERIAYVNKTTREIITYSQTQMGGIAGGWESLGYEATEQFYASNARSFTVTVNVYANATVVNAG